MAKVFKYGDSVDTDVILPARYLALYKSEDLAQHCLEDIDENFAKSVREGDVIVAGDNFGCGSSREHAPASIKACGVSCVIAVSFARIFYRNAINIGLPIFECPEAAKDIQNGDELDVNLKTAEIKNLTRHKTYQAAAFPPFIQRIIDAGGLLSSINK
ncbi:MAG: 3-isopropylmalate dehydratase small subunit [Treponema sp.]|jgi:3-isopropylmalate/(R)-2-methylmalate dehydratase small subunit|nr:3-isopropylmalate dehydratase small subunit [Treponema sp.]